MLSRAPKLRHAPRLQRIPEPPPLRDTDSVGLGAAGDPAFPTNSRARWLAWGFGNLEGWGWADLRSQSGLPMPSGELCG